MPNTNLCYSVDIKSGTIVTGTSPDNLLLSAQTAVLRQLKTGALDTFYIDSTIGMYKTNSGGVEAAYYFQKRTGANLMSTLARTLNPDYVKHEALFYEEIHLEFDDCSPFKMAFLVGASTNFLDQNRTVRLIFESLTVGEVHYWIEVFDAAQPNSTRQVTEVKSLDLTWLSAPYPFMFRVYHMVQGIGFEVKNEYDYYTDYPGLTDFVELLGNNPPSNAAYLSCIMYSRTVLKYPAITKYGWGAVKYEENVINAASTTIIETEDRQISKGQLQAQANPGLFEAFTFYPSERQGSNQGVLVTDKLILTLTKLDIPGMVYPLQSGFSSNYCKYFGGENSPNTIEINFNKPLVVLLPPATTVRYTIKFKQK